MAKVITNFKIIISDDPQTPQVPDSVKTDYIVSDDINTDLYKRIRGTYTSPDFGRTATELYGDALLDAEINEGIESGSG